MRPMLTALVVPVLLLGLTACGPQDAPDESPGSPSIEEPTPEEPSTEEPSTGTSPSLRVSDGGGDDDEVVQPTETTEYSEQGEDSGS